MMEKTEVLAMTFVCFVLAFFVAFWTDSFILTSVVCGLQVGASVWLVTLWDFKWGTTKNPGFILCFGFGIGCKVLGVLMLLFPLTGFSIFSSFYTAGTICTLGSLIFLIEHSVQMKINEMVEAKVKTFVNDASAHVKRLSEQLENVCNSYMDESKWETYTEWYSDIGGIAQCLCVLLFPELGVLLLALNAVLDVGVRRQAGVGVVVLGAVGGMGVLALVGLAGLGGLGLGCLGGVAALTMGGLGGLGARVFGKLDGLVFLTLEVLGGLAALSMGGPGGLCALAIGNLGGLVTVIIGGLNEHKGTGGKENHPSAALAMGVLGGIAALAMGGLNLLGSLAMGGLGGLGSLAMGKMGGLSGPGGVRGQGSPSREHENVHDKKPRGGKKQDQMDGKSNKLEDKVKHKLMKALHYVILAAVLWFWGPALMLLLLKFLVWALFYILRHCPKPILAILCFIFGAGCTIMGVYLRFLPGFSMLLFSIFYTVGNVCMLESTLPFEDFSKQRIMMFDNTRVAVTSVLLSCLVLTLLALFWVSSRNR
ncbi:hypothetical protein NL108_006561 [Boleophthalmus pectinirostris]|nr:hypothetical protein NL108_006561 [Boleophthalmus pectinirostris]